MPAKKPSPAKPAARSPRKRTSARAATVSASADPAAPPAQPRHRWHLVVTAVLAFSGVAYHYRDRIPRPTIVPSADVQLARSVSRTHSQLLISEIIVPLRKANDGTLTNEQALAIWKNSLPIIQRHTLSPLTDRMTDLQAIGPDGKPTGQMDREQLDRCLKDWEAGL